MLNHREARLSDMTSALHVWPAGKAKSTQTQTETEMGYSAQQRRGNRIKRRA